MGVVPPVVIVVFQPSITASHSESDSQVFCQPPIGSPHRCPTVKVPRRIVQVEDTLLRDVVYLGRTLDRSSCSTVVSGGSYFQPFQQFGMGQHSALRASCLVGLLGSHVERNRPCRRPRSSVPAGGDWLAFRLTPVPYASSFVRIPKLPRRIGLACALPTGSAAQFVVIHQVTVTSRRRYVVRSR